TNAVTASIPAATRGTAVGVDLVTVVTLFVVLRPGRRAVGLNDSVTAGRRLTAVGAGVGIVVVAVVAGLRCARAGFAVLAQAVVVAAHGCILLGRCARTTTAGALFADFADSVIVTTRGGVELNHVSTCGRYVHVSVTAGGQG